MIELELGNTSNIKWFEGLGEYRIHWGPGYRIYLIQEGKRLIILFGGGDKPPLKKRHQTRKSFDSGISRSEKS